MRQPEPTADTTMSTDFSSLHNHRETAVFQAVTDLAPEHPGLADDPELLADVACVALNRLQPRYIRHAVDFAFYLSDSERAQAQQQVDAAVRQAFAFVQARAAMRARA
jgi:hypothetical protein